METRDVMELLLLAVWLARASAGKIRVTEFGGMIIKKTKIMRKKWMNQGLVVVAYQKRKA